MAQYLVGVAYAGGDGVTQDKSEAVKWFGKSAGQGYKRANDALARLWAEESIKKKPGK